MHSTKASSTRNSADSTATLLIDIATEHADVWHDPSGTAYATITDVGWAQNIKINSKLFAGWLSTTLFRREHIAAMPGQLSSAVLIIEQLALVAAQRELYTRVGHSEAGIVIDLNDHADSCICASAEGWKIVQNSGARFLRTPGMRPMVVPQSSGSIKPLFDLLALLNFDEEQSALVAGWLLTSLNPNGSHFILAISGERGCGATTACRTLKQLIDPAASPLRALPKSDDDLCATAVNNWCLSFDDVPRIPNWLADSLCRLSTGGAFSKRAAHASSGETMLELRRPAILSGTEQLAATPDLLERSLCVQMKRLSQQRRLPEGTLAREIEQLLPQALGGLLDALVFSLAGAPEQPGISGCLADAVAFAASASATPGWGNVSFMDAYTACREQSATVSMECSPLLQILIGEITPSHPFEGTATELLQIVKLGAKRKQFSAKDLPVDALRLSGALTRIAPVLREFGIEFERPGHGKTRVLKLYRKSPLGLVDDTTLAKPLTSTPKPKQSQAFQTVDVNDVNSGKLSRKQKRQLNGWPIAKA